MNVVDIAIAGRAAELGAEFDRSFAQPAYTDDDHRIDIVTLRVATASYAVRISEIAGLFADIWITRCPSHVAEFRGLIGVRGALFPVYDLAALLGHSSGQPRWILVGKAAPVAFAFEAYDGHFRLSSKAIAARGAGQSTQAIASHNGNAWPIIDIANLIAAIRKKSPQPAIHKE